MAEPPSGPHEGARGGPTVPALPSRLPGLVFQIVLVSSSLSDRDQSLFLSTDEGATFQKQLVPFAVETLIFHPKEEDKVLAYSKESKVSGGAGAQWARGHMRLPPHGVPGAPLPGLWVVWMPPHPGRCLVWGRSWGGERCTWHR